MPSPAQTVAVLPNPFVPFPTPVSWDVGFKIAQIAFVRLVPLARSMRRTLFAVSTGFNAQDTNLVQAMYRRHGVAGCDLAAIFQRDQKLADLPARLEAATGAPAHERFDFLSLIEGDQVEQVCRCIFTGDFRPGLIHHANAPAMSGWPKIRTDLLRIGYALAGEMNGGELLIDSSLLDDGPKKPVIATFDVFDTLIARRCLEPWRVFDEVGRLIGLADFVEQRRAAEARVVHTRYVFDDVYDELARHYRWTQAEREHVQALEMERELANVVPIAENLARVKDGDLLVSDMYLSEAQIRSLVEKAGLAAKVGLLVESHGKSHGRVWPEIKDAFIVTRHLGDNPDADVAVAERFGFATQLTEASTPTLIERTLLDAGLRSLSLLARETRLASWHDDPAIRALQLVQSSLNVPLLIVASVALARRAKALDTSSILFCSRDCNLWRPLFEALQPRLGCAFETDYFLTSRIARKKGSDDYLAYARGLMRPGALVVDLCGTGWSMAQLVDRLRLPRADLFLLDACPSNDLYDAARTVADTCRIHSLFAERPNVDNVVLELANAADHRMVVDMRAVGNTFVPILSANALSAEESEAVRQQRACFLSAIDRLPHHALDDVFALDDASLAYVCATLYETMTRQLACFKIFEKRFFEDDESIVQALTGCSNTRKEF